VQFATEAALRMRMPVSICGELAAAPKLTPLLLGLGVRSLSMNASAVPKVKQVIRSVEIGACTRFARRLMDQTDPECIRALVNGFGQGGD
jgi:phosphoenolpyruvate-protein kinase (PTS system EI component)